MAKKIKAKLKLQIPGGAATPAPPVGSVLGPQGVSTAEFCKRFNAVTADRRGQTVPVLITIYADRTFDFETKTPPVSELIRKKINIAKGSSNPGSDVAGSISRADLEEIATIKLPDLNAFSLEAAVEIIAGSARSMGLKISE